MTIYIGNMLNIVKNVIKIVVFMTIVIILTYILGRIFLPYNSETSIQSKSFYEMEENTIDVLIVGTSTVLVGLSPLELYDRYGIVAYTRGSSRQPPEITYLNVKETYNYQNPKVVVMSVSGIFLDFDMNDYEPYYRRGMDYKRLSFDKLKVAYYIDKKSSSQHMLDYIFPILRYHDRWREMTVENTDLFRNEHDYMRGQYTVYETVSIEPRDTVEKLEAKKDYRESEWYWYKKTIDLCKENGTEVIIVYMPDDKWDYSWYNTVKNLADKENVAYIDFNIETIINDLNLDWDRDFYNSME